MAKKKKYMKFVAENIGLNLGVAVGSNVVGSLSGSIPSSNQKNILKGMEITSMIPMVHAGSGLMSITNDMFKSTKRKRKKKR